MPNITINVGELYNKKAAMQAVSENLKRDAQAVINYATQISEGGWSGDNANLYLNEFNEFKPKLDLKAQAIEVAALALNETINILTNVQDDTKAKIAALAQGIAANSASVAQTPATAPTPVTPEVVAPDVPNTNPEMVSPTPETTPAQDEISATIPGSEGIPDATTMPVSDVPNVHQATAYQVTDEERLKLYALTYSEDNGSKEGAMAVMSTICNRADQGNWGGTNPISVGFAPNQFVGTKSKNYTSAIKNPDIIPQYVKDAVDETLAGNRNHTYLSFRGNQNSAPGREQIGSNGNYYFNSIC